MMLLPLYGNRTYHQDYQAGLPSRQLSRAFCAIANAPSKVLFPPMNPAAWTNTHPGIPEILSSSSSRNPLHASGSGRRLSNESLDTGTHCTRHLASGVGFSGAYRWSFHGTACPRRTRMRGSVFSPSSRKAASTMARAGSHAPAK
ncbi:hypothetical protein VTK73DRAFT_5001 [Phialemonium thermophilum]|uniref:Uncharacterized protein n=1 Tax=Phialemonium thermophilum TaxID=223376 RepID=A0ABR3V5A0_9PEZI